METFALVQGAEPVEGLTVGPDGKVYSPTFHFGAALPSECKTVHL